MANVPDKVVIDVGAERVRDPLFPEGTEFAVLVDVVDLGMVPASYQGKDQGLKAKVMLIFAGPTAINPETGAPSKTFIRPEFALSLAPTASLRKFLKQWFGRDIKDEDVRKQGGLSLHTLVGHPILLTVEHVVARTGNTYAKIVSASPAPVKMLDPELKEEFRLAVAQYERDGLTRYLMEKAVKERDEYVRALGLTPAAKRAATANPAAGPLDDDEDDLPF